MNLSIKITDYKKKYNDALERARDLMSNQNYSDLDKLLIETIFPELKDVKEDENTRIKKVLIDYFQKYKEQEDCGIKTFYGIPTDDILAWLEKRGEQKPNYCHHEVDLSGCSEEYKKAYYDGWNNCNMQHSQCKSELDDVLKCLINGMKFYYEDNKDATWGTYKWSMPVKHIIEVLEKQGEQKPVDKVEPRFKVKYAGSEYNVLEVKDIAGVTFYGIEDEPNHIDYVKPENCEIISGYAIKENGSPYPTKPAVFSEKKPTAWLEKQGKETSWKPSKEEMDVLYGLAYITNQYDEHKEEVITRLYQDLKREFFNGSSYENMFPTNTSAEDDVRRRSTIQVLEYARSLDACNQFGKADIDKNIAWLEKQRNNSTSIDIDEMVMKYSQTKDGDFGLPVNCMIRAYRQGINDALNLSSCIEKQGEQKPADKVEPKFKVGDWIVQENIGIYKVIEVCESWYEVVDNKDERYSISFDKEYMCHLWTINDANDGDVLVDSYSKDSIIILYKGIYKERSILAHCGWNGYNFSIKTNGFGYGGLDNTDYLPATKEQRDLLFEKMKNTGYEWDAENKELKQY